MMYTYIYTMMYLYIYVYIVCIYIYPPTPAFAKAGAAPGTTGGVERFCCHAEPKQQGLTTPHRGLTLFAGIQGCRLPAAKTL